MNGKDPPVAHTEISASGADPRATTDPHEVDPLLGLQIAQRYQVLSLLGRGGMGSVYVCEHVQLKKRMALKVLAEEYRRQPELVARFLKEARAAAQIGHPNIVDVYDLGELDAGGAYIAMALLEGEDLQQEIERGGSMPFARARIIVGQVCRALAAAHGKGIVHRDMKPANVFLARDADGGEQVKVLDFGIAQVNEVTEGEAARLTQTGAIVGTPAFMSPEQGRGERADHRTDVYSVGCILYNLIVGEVPFDGNTIMGVISKHLFEPPVPPSRRVPTALISAEVDAVVLRAMAKDPAARFQTMKEMWIALEACSSDTPMEWPDASSGRFVRIPSGTTPALPPRGAAQASASIAATTPEVSPRRGGLMFVVGALAASALVAGGVVLVHRPVPVPGAHAIPPASPAPPSAPSTEVTIELRTIPPGAVVRVGARELGATPLQLLRPRSTEAVTLLISLPGYAEEAISLTLDRDLVVDRQLQALRATKAPAISPKPPVHDAPGHHATGVRKAGRAGDLKDPFSK